MRMAVVTRERAAATRASAAVTTARAWSAVAGPGVCGRTAFAVGALSDESGESPTVNSRIRRAVRGPAGRGARGAARRLAAAARRQRGRAGDPDGDGRGPHDRWGTGPLRRTPARFRAPAGSRPPAARHRCHHHPSIPPPPYRLGSHRDNDGLERPVTPDTVVSCPKSDLRPSPRGRRTPARGPPAVPGTATAPASSSAGPSRSPAARAAGRGPRAGPATGRDGTRPSTRAVEGPPGHGPRVADPERMRTAGPDAVAAGGRWAGTR